MKKSYITVTDQFCGAGGSSSGAKKYLDKIGGKVAMAMNHWKLAIETHSTNFPDTNDRGLIINHQTPDIEDCYYRMIKPPEVKRAMAFDDSYKILGTGKDQVKQCGNAVTPPVMEWLIERVVESLM